MKKNKKGEDSTKQCFPRHKLCLDLSM